MSFNGNYLISIKEKQKYCLATYFSNKLINYRKIKIAKQQKSKNKIIKEVFTKLITKKT